MKEHRRPYKQKACSPFYKNIKAASKEKEGCLPYFFDGLYLPLRFAIIRKIDISFINIFQ